MNMGVFDMLATNPRARKALFIVLVIGLVVSFIWIATRPTGDGATAPNQGGAAAPSRPAVITPTASPGPAKVTEADVRRFLEARSTFSWSEGADVYEKRVVAAGAVPGSQAAEPIYREQSLALCVEERCSLRFVRIEDITMPTEEEPVVTATVFIEASRNGGFGVTPSFCTLTVAEGADSQNGLFVNQACVTVEGAAEA